MCENYFLKKIMKLIIKKINKKIIKKALKFFPKNFFQKLKKEKIGTYNESLVARYLIKKNWKNYSSISHKKNLVFVWIKNSKIWVDIEIIKKRDENLLNKFLDKEYKILGKKNWKNFYILWTIKESIIKFENLSLDNIEEILLIKTKKINKKISNLYFEKKLILEFKKNNLENNDEKKLKIKKFITYFWIKNKIIYSICVGNK